MGRNKDKYADFMEDHRYEDDNDQNGYNDDYSDDYDQKNRKKNKKQKKRDRNRNQYEEDDDYQSPQESFNEADESEQDQYNESDQYDDEQDDDDPSEDQDDYSRSGKLEAADSASSTPQNYQQVNSSSTSPSVVNPTPQNRAAQPSSASTPNNAGAQAAVKPQIINTFSNGSSFSFRSTPANVTNTNKSGQSAVSGPDTAQTKQEPAPSKPSFVPQRPVFTEQKNNASVNTAQPAPNNQSASVKPAFKPELPSGSDLSAHRKTISNKAPNEKDPTLLSASENPNSDDALRKPSLFTKLSHKMKNCLSALSHKKDDSQEASENNTSTNAALSQKSDQKTSSLSATFEKDNSVLKESNNNKDILKIKDKTENNPDLSEKPKIKDRLKNTCNLVLSRFHRKKEVNSDADSNEKIEPTAILTPTKSSSEVKPQISPQTQTSKNSSSETSLISDKDPADDDDPIELPRNWAKIRKQTIIITVAITIVLAIGYSSFALMTGKKDLVANNLTSSDETSAIADLKDSQSLISPKNAASASSKDKVNLPNGKETEAPKKSFFSFLKFWEKSDKESVSSDAKKDSLSIAGKGSDKSSSKELPPSDEKDVLLTLKKNENIPGKAAAIALPKSKDSNKDDIIPLPTPKDKKSAEQKILSSVKSLNNNSKPAQITVTDPLHPNQKINITADSEKKSLTVAPASSQDPLTSDQIKENLKKDLDKKASELAAQLPKSVDIPLTKDKKATINIDTEKAKNANGELDLRQIKPKSVDLSDGSNKKATVTFDNANSGNLNGNSALDPLKPKSVEISDGSNKKATVTFDNANSGNLNGNSALDPLKPKSIEISNGSDNKATLTFGPANPSNHLEGALPVPSAETVKPPVPLPSATAETVPAPNNPNITNGNPAINNIPLPALESGTPNSGISSSNSPIPNSSPSQAAPIASTGTTNQLSLSSVPQSAPASSDSLSLASQQAPQSVPSLQPQSSAGSTSADNSLSLPVQTPISTTAPSVPITPAPTANAAQPPLIASAVPALSATAPISTSNQQALSPTPTSSPLNRNNTEAQTPAVSNTNTAAISGVQSVPSAMAGSQSPNQGATFAPVTSAGNYSLSPFGSYSIPGEVIHTENLNSTGTAVVSQNQQSSNNVDINTNNPLQTGQGINGNSSVPQNQTAVMPLQNVNSTNGSQTNSGTQTAYREYTTMEGDNLLSIAGHELGDSLRWSEIRDLNPEAVSKLSESSPTFPVGTKLYLPPYDKGNQ